MSNENEKPDLGVPDLPPLDATAAIDGEMMQVEPQAPDNGDPAVAGMLVGVFVLLFDAVAARRGAHWKLQQAEAVELGNSSAALISKYFPNAQASPEMRLLMVAGAVVGIRYAADVAIAKRKEQEAAAGDDKKPD